MKEELAVTEEFAGHLSSLLFNVKIATHGKKSRYLLKQGCNIAPSMEEKTQPTNAESVGLALAMKGYLSEVIFV